MLLENIPMGKTLEIYIDREGYRYRLVSKVEDAKPRRVCVSLIASNGRAFRFHPEDDIKIVYRDEEQMWEWPKVRGGIAKLDDEPVHYFEITNKGHSFNRRNAYRVQISEDIEIGFYILPETGQKSDEPPVVEVAEGQEVIDEQQIAAPQRVHGIIKDVSETGVGIYTDASFDTDDRMFFEMPSPYGMLACSAQVVRKDELRASSHKYQYYYGCVLTKSDKRLIRYIFDIQRENLKKQRG